MKGKVRVRVQGKVMLEVEVRVRVMRVGVPLVVDHSDSTRLR